MSFNTNRWSCYRWRHALNSAKNFLGKIFLIKWVFIGETRLPLYPSWCQITHLTKQQRLGSSHSPAPQFWKSVGAPKEWPIWGGKKFFWTPQKKFHQGNGCDMCFLQKNWKKSVKFGLGGRSNISLPRIGGSHPVPSLSLLSTERRGYSNVLQYSWDVF